MKIPWLASTLLTPIVPRAGAWSGWIGAHRIYLFPP